jgi:hypothetical protein
MKIDPKAIFPMVVELIHAQPNGDLHVDRGDNAGGMRVMHPPEQVKHLFEDGREVTCKPSFICIVAVSGKGLKPMEKMAIASDPEASAQFIFSNN